MERRKSSIVAWTAALWVTVVKGTVSERGATASLRKWSIMLLASRSVWLRLAMVSPYVSFSWSSKVLRLSWETYIRALVLLPGVCRKQRVAACKTKLLEVLRLRARAQAKRLGQFHPSVPLLTNKITR